MVEVRGLLCKPPHPGKANIASAAASLQNVNSEALEIVYK